MECFYNFTPTRQYVVFDTPDGYVGYGWPLPRFRRCGRGKRRYHRRAFSHPYCEYPFSGFFPRLPFSTYGGFPDDGCHGFGGGHYGPFGSGCVY